MEVFEHLSYIFENYPEERSLESYVFVQNIQKRVQLLRVPMSDENYLALSLTPAVSEGDQNKYLFVTIHTARPKNKLNLKKLSLLDEVYALASAVENIKYEGWRKFFEKVFPQSSRKKSKLDRLPKLGSNELNEEWRRVELNVNDLKIEHHSIQVENMIEKSGLNEMSFEEIEEGFQEYLKENKWEHLVLFKTNNLFFVISITKYKSFLCGITTGNPLNYIKFKDYSFIMRLKDLITVSKYFLDQYPLIKDLINKYQKFQS